MGLFGRDAAFAIVFFAVVALLTAATMGLSRVMDPALAALALGTGILVILAVTVAVVGRAPKQDPVSLNDR